MRYTDPFKSTTAMVKTMELDRFRGLTPKQIRALIEIDEQAMEVSRFVGVEERHGINTIESAYAKAGFPFTPDTMLEYARRAEAKQSFGAAQAWYDAYARHADDATPLRKFLISRGWLDQAQERFTLTPEELRAMGDAAVADSNIRLAIAAYTKCAHRAGIALILRQELRRDGNDNIAQEAAKALGRDLTRKEHAAIARREMRLDPSNAFMRIRRYHLTELHQPFIAHVLSELSTRTKDILKWAKALEVTITARDLEERFELLWPLGSRMNQIEAIGIAERLAKTSKEWRARLPGLYAEARKEAFETQDPKTAERFGRKCGQPLTATELLILAEYFGRSDHRELNWAIGGRKFCLDLAVKRIAKAVRAKGKKK